MNACKLIIRRQNNALTIFVFGGMGENGTLPPHTHTRTPPQIFIIPFMHIQQIKIFNKWMFSVQRCLFDRIRRVFILFAFVFHCIQQACGSVNLLPSSNYYWALNNSQILVWTRNDRWFANVCVYIVLYTPHANMALMLARVRSYIILVISTLAFFVADCIFGVDASGICCIVRRLLPSQTLFALFCCIITHPCVGALS